MKKKKGAIIAAIVVVIILAAAFVLQENPNTDREAPGAQLAGASQPSNSSPGDSVPAAVPPSAQGDTAPAPESAKPDEGQSPGGTVPANTDTDPAGLPEAPADVQNAPAVTNPPTDAQTPPAAEVAAPLEKETLTCSLTVSCATVLNNMDKLAKGKESIIPADGIFLKLDRVEFQEGDSVFDILQRELKNRNMHIEFSTSPMYGSVYVEGICNLYEFDCGELSGWLYSVNGAKYSYASSEFLVSDGDVLQWLYTCDNGADLP